MNEEDRRLRIPAGKLTYSTWVDQEGSKADASTDGNDHPIYAGVTVSPPVGTVCKPGTFAIQLDKPNDIHVDYLKGGESGANIKGAWPVAGAREVRIHTAECEIKGGNE